MYFVLVATIIGGLALAIQYVSADTTVMSDNFTAYTNGATIRDATTYSFGTFPAQGSDAGATKWQLDTGTLKARADATGNKWGETQTSDLYRLYTTNTAQEAVVQWRYKAATENNATDVWLRLQTQYQLYALQFDRGDDCLVAKRKMPTNTSATGEWGGVAAGRGGEIANKGVYYVLRIDSDQPAHTGGPCNQDGVRWTDLTMGTSTITHDGTTSGGTTYTFKATAHTVPAGTGTCTGVAFDCVQIQLFRGGTLVASWTDKNNGLNSSAARTLQQDCDAGYYAGVTGYQASWCLPIYAAGLSGFRNDDVQMIWIDDFSLTEASGEAPTAPTVNLDAVPSSITSGQQSTLSWAATDSTTCTKSNGWSGATTTAGTLKVSPVATTTYTLACTGIGGTATDTATVDFIPAAVPVATPTQAIPDAVSIRSGNSIRVGTGVTITFH